MNRDEIITVMRFDQLNRWTKLLRSYVESESNMNKKKIAGIIFVK